MGPLVASGSAAGKTVDTQDPRGLWPLAVVVAVSNEQKRARLPHGEVDRPEVVGELGKRRELDVRPRARLPRAGRRQGRVDPDVVTATHQPVRPLSQAAYHANNLGLRTGFPVPVGHALADVKEQLAIPTDVLG